MNADIAEGVRVGDHITFHRLVYEVLRLGGVYSTDAGPKRYLYVKAVPVIKDAATSGPTLHVKEVPTAKGRAVEMIRHPYCEPTYLHVEIKPRLKRVVVSTRSIWFSESRGYGGQSSNKSGVTFSSESDPIYIAAAAFVAGDDMAIVGLADAIEESGQKGPVAKLRWFYELARQENPEAYLAKIRRDKAYADCRFKVGDMVLPIHSYGKDPVAVVAVYWSEAGVEWRVGIKGMDAPQSHFYLAPLAPETSS